MPTIFLVEDDGHTRRLVREYLVREGFKVEAFASLEEMAARLKEGYPDLFVLDIMLPGEDGLTFCRRLRASSPVPVIFISARGDELDRVLGLELGGDDYLSKPFSPRELVARVKAILRRSPRPSPQELRLNNLCLIPSRRQATVDGKELELTPKEFELLLALAANPRAAFSRDQLLDRIWGYDYAGDIRAVDDLVKRVRKKLREIGARVEIVTVWGYGYRLKI